MAKKQWPYDVELLAEILKDVKGRLDGKTVIGIADGGLADATGGPLAVVMFAPSPEKLKKDGEREPVADPADRDENGYLDDFYGAGISRGKDEDKGTGHLGLCRDIQPPFASWNNILPASHGTVVASIAAALGVRKTVGNDSLLPPLTFFRMLRNACQPSDTLGVGAGAFQIAFDYLEDRGARIVNFSYKIDNDEGESFSLQMKKRLLLRDQILLVLPAGNANAGAGGNLDEMPLCPACLGHDAASRGGDAAARTLVVGAANRDLTRDVQSNFGRFTVKMFAPGEPTYAIDLAGRSVPSTETATSYAAPYVALAAGMIRSFIGVNSSADTRDRL